MKAVEKQKQSKFPMLSVGDEGECTVVAESPEQINGIFGTNTYEFSTAMLSHCINVSGKKEDAAEDKNHALAIVAEITPTDGLEAMLATQMAATHIAMMRHSRLMATVDTIAQLDVHEKVFNKLGRTFTIQMEALRKHRHGGKQTVTVQHVTVSDGGQAIVGHVAAGGRGADEK